MDWQHPIDSFSLTDAQLSERLASFEALLSPSLPLHLVLPAFPAKSPNRRKTLSALPDYGEVLALRHLNDLCARVEKFHSPGARVTICSDGRVFSDLVQVPDSDVDAYGLEIKAIIAEYRLTNLLTYSLEDAFPDARSYDEMRSRLTETYAEPLEAVRGKVKSSADYSRLFNGIHRFMLEDQLVLDPQTSKNKLRERAKFLAYGVIQRSNAWSNLVEQRIPNTVRLSIHPQPPSSRKVWIRLLPSLDVWRTPWHAVTLFDGKDYVLTPREDAEAKGAVLSHARGRYPYFVLPQFFGEERAAHV